MASGCAAMFALCNGVVRCADVRSSITPIMNPGKSLYYKDNAYQVSIDSTAFKRIRHGPGRTRYPMPSVQSGFILQKRERSKPCSVRWSDQAMMLWSGWTWACTEWLLLLEDAAQDETDFVLGCFPAPELRSSSGRLTRNKPSTSSRLDLALSLWLCTWEVRFSPLFVVVIIEFAFRFASFF